MPDTLVGLRPARRGALDGVGVIEAPGIHAVPLPPLARWVVRGDPAPAAAAFGVEIPREACRAADRGERAALWLGPDEWLLLAPAETRLDMRDWAGGCLVGVSCRQGAIAVEGERAAELLLMGCPQDLEAAPVGYCSRTVLGKAEVVVWRTAPGRWHVEAGRSFLAYVWTLLAESALSLPR